MLLLFLGGVGVGGGGFKDLLSSGVILVETKVSDDKDISLGSVLSVFLDKSRHNIIMNTFYPKMMTEQRIENVA